MLMEEARKTKKATQMGNQGHSSEGMKLMCEWIWDGAIGKVREVDVWTTHAVWPQGMTSRPGGYSTRARHPGLGPLAGSCPSPAIQPGLYTEPLAGMVGFWHRGGRGHGLPQHGSRDDGPEAGSSDERGGLVFDLCSVP